ncbi:indolepyruvate oxidoreductase subunit beta [Fusibacter paucivorans]|uniref:Indolepyruvate oxidoreductase subunit beta n=1 Tax=Fusibacter paucivorans TaxID=76009 RepID=A0ABS5PLB2_9FIRM|nr:indolepyruvate oxidoreductase subunit beta [Fusibacter paucivorans]MBS7525954.1 indolepyruvate oxidoreductase subunit beta [Fusibacter paucivorans]
MTKNILLVGVGGQGTILASKLLTIGLMKSGYDVKMSEIHGMSQRGGSVSSQVRFGDNVASPVIEAGSADILVAFEKMEAMRWMPYLKKDGKLIVNDFEINPMPVLTGRAQYSSDIKSVLTDATKTDFVDASSAAMTIGNPKVMNIILLGALVKAMGLEAIDWHAIIASEVKPKFIELNKRAFDQGMQMIS